ncbi:TIGR02300 family protein [Dichotomicrobium thermohalophilum]|uniref:Uncharacterized protein (TIGR02300 family) n=1 Tax=Dichotomicrobium thermohalophilum TaxID=933063 RepID=A0A397PJ77_9HYPH|nr:TIGR02300 family protein [Dichotomicrobium thermohalophilum]RIA47335.1 uncharacterized protein (TIGR02300 family) [Dichotomicrobium thermohalophilum]
MSNKAARGTKRTCQSCGARFYDLNRDPIICPVCGAEFKLTGEAAQAHAQRAAEAREQEADTEVAPETEDVEVVPLEEAEASEEDIPDIESEDLDDLDAESNLSSDEDALMPDDDSEDDDVSGFLGGSINEDQEDET